MKTRYTPLIVTVVFFAGVLAMLQLLRYVSRQSTLREQGKINSVMQSRVDPEVAIFGASNALVAFDAPLIQELTHLETYNFSMNGTGFEQYRALVWEFASRTKRARYIVFGETFLTFRRRKAIFRPAFYANYLSSPHIFKALSGIDDDLTARLRYVPFYLFIAADEEYYKLMARSFLSMIGKGVDQERQGFWPRDEKWTGAGIEGETVANDQQIMRHFSELLEYLTSRGFKVFVVVTPLQRQCHKLVEGFDASRDLLRRQTGNAATFIDYTDDPLADDVDNFYNCSHLNRRGAATFSKRFATNLLESD